MIERLNAGTICNRIVTVAERSMSLEEAARLMREQHVGCLIVVDRAPAGAVVAGVLTDRDIVTAVVAQGMAPATLQVEDVMSSEVATVPEEASMQDVLDLMRRKGVRRVPVTTPKGVLVGLVTLDDVLELLAEELRGMARAVEAEQLKERRQRP